MINFYVQDVEESITEIDVVMDVALGFSFRIAALFFFIFSATVEYIYYKCHDEERFKYQSPDKGLIYSNYIYINIFSMTKLLTNMR